MARTIDRWTLSGLVESFRQAEKVMGDRRFAFILGAGTSVSSGIPSGGKMATRWLTELQIREDRFYDRGHTLRQWATPENLGIAGFSLEKVAEFYPELFERTFRNDPKRGYLDLEQAMEGAFPGVGYSILAQILASTRHKVVVTTNFDNLVAEALSIYAGTQPLVCGHESLAGFARVQLRRPLVLKIHRDLFLNPMNDRSTVSRLADGWVGALNELFRHYVPLVIGYGGNDGSLMGYLKGLDPEHLPGQLVWCYRQADGEPGPKVMDVLQHLGGALVPIPGFDELMLGFGACLGMGPLDNHLLEDAHTRVRRYREQLSQLQASMTAAQTGVEDESEQEVSVVPPGQEERITHNPKDLGAEVDSLLDNLMEKTGELPTPIVDPALQGEATSRETSAPEPITKELPASLPAREPVTKELPVPSPGEFLPTTVMFEAKEAEADLGVEPPLRTIPAAKPPPSRRPGATLILPPPGPSLAGSAAGNPSPSATATSSIGGPLSPGGRRAQPATALLPGVGPTLSKIGPPPLDNPLPVGGLSPRGGASAPRSPAPAGPGLHSPTQAPPKASDEPEEDTLILRLNAARQQAEKERSKKESFQHPALEVAPAPPPPALAPTPQVPRPEGQSPQSRREAASQALDWFSQIFGEPPTEKVLPSAAPVSSQSKPPKEPS